MKTKVIVFILSLKLNFCMVLFCLGKVHHNIVFVGELAVGELRQWRVLSACSCNRREFAGIHSLFQSVLSYVLLAKC